jgi:hypothetical protein
MKKYGAELVGTFWLVLVLAALMWVGDGWAMTFDEMAEEMKTIPTQGRTSHDMYFRIPMVCSGTTCMHVTELCVAGGSVRPKDPGKASMDMGKAPPKTEYSIPVYKRFVSESGDHIILYHRMVELPACK